MEIKKSVTDLFEAQQAYELLAFDEDYEGKLGAPVAESRIAALEARLGVRFPQQYRDFLSAFDGWEIFAGDGKLLAVEDHGSQWESDLVQFWSNIWESEDPNPFPEGMIPIMMGEGLEHFLVLDPAQKNTDGEPVFLRFDSMEIEQRFDYFGDFLQSDLDSFRELIDDEKSGIEDVEDED